MLMILDKKNGKPHWKAWNPKIQGYEFIPDEENSRMWKEEQDISEKIAADIYNKHFNSESE